MIDRYSYISRFRRKSVFVILFCSFIGLSSSSVVMGQTHVPAPAQDFDRDDHAEARPTIKLLDSCGRTSLVVEQAVSNTEAVAQNVEQELWPDYNMYTEADSSHLTAFWDMNSNRSTNVFEAYTLQIQTLTQQLFLKFGTFKR